MRKIFVLIKCQLGKSYDVAARLIDEIDEAPAVDSISGDYDLIATFFVASDTDIGRFVNENVHAIPNIVDTKTIICFNAFTKDAGVSGD